MGNNQQIILEVKNLKKYFPLQKDFLGRPQAYLKAVDNVTFKLEKGKTIGVVGESGCGKTTLGRTILQLYETTGGKTLYYGHTIEEKLPKYYIKSINKLPTYKKEYETLLTKLTNLLEQYSSYLNLLNNVNTLDDYENLLELINNYQQTLDETKKEEINNIKEIVKTLTKLINVLNEASIVSGGIILSDANLGKELLLNKIAQEHTLIKLNEKQEEILKKLEKAQEKESLLDELKELEEQITTKEKDLEKANKVYLEFKQGIKETPLFKDLETKIETGLDLAKLTKQELRLLRTEIQLIFQDPYSSLPPRMTIGSILKEPVVVHNIVEKEHVNEHVRKIMKMCGLQPQYYDRYPHEFSGGQRQRICIARALAVNPKLVICDEPVSALDVSIQAQIINLLKELQNTLGLTYMFISHDLSVVKYITDSIIVMYLGNMMEIGNTKEIFENPLHPYTKALFSAVPVPDPDAKMNRIILKGDIPSPANPPKGCKFHTRCDKCMSVCKLKAPTFINCGDNHLVACHLYDQEIMANLKEYDEILQQEENLNNKVLENQNENK